MRQVLVAMHRIMLIFASWAAIIPMGRTFHRFCFPTRKCGNPERVQCNPRSMNTQTSHVEAAWLPVGFERAKARRRKKLMDPIRVTTIPQLKECIKEGYRVQDLDVRGDTYGVLGVPGKIHPVLKALYARRNDKSMPGQRGAHDKMKIALAIEGGGMRGCVAAGMATALWHLGLDDSIDIVYGSSAGTLVGAYFISKQLPYNGPEIYYDVLTSAGEEFIDAQSILRSCGLGLFDLRLQSLVSLFRDRMGKPVLNLDYLLTTIVQKIKPLDWATFWSKQESNAQPLKIVASGLLSKKAVVLSAANDNFKTASELAHCMKASMLLPGVTGEVIRLKGEQALGSNIETTWWREFPRDSRAEDGEFIRGSEPMSDALVFEPLPYRSALNENCTHIIVLRTRADDISVTMKMSKMEQMIMSRWFGRKLGLPHMVSWMHNQYHKLVYAEDILILNEASRDMDSSSSKPKLFCLALPKGIPEVKRLETSRSVIFNSVRQGFAAAYDNLVEDPTMRGRGWETACLIWPDSILDSAPVHLQTVSATAELAPLPEEIVGAFEMGVMQMAESKRSALVRALHNLQAIVMGGRRVE